MFNPKKLGDVLRLHRGYDITKAQQSPGPYPVVSSSGVGSFHSDYKSEGPGVVIGRKGSLGTVFYLTKRHWPHDTTLYVEDFKGNDPRYCYYLLKTLALERYDVGASNPTLNRNHLHELDVHVPFPVVQERIASILSAYDDLIENNTRRIAILEEVARRIFEEWFVHFRAPGCEGLPMIDSPSGPIPKGWEVKRLEELASIQLGQSPKSAFYKRSGEGLPFHQGVTDFEDFFPTNRVFCTELSRVAQPDDILVSVRAPVGRINIALEKLVIGRGISAIRSEQGRQKFLLSQLRSFFRDEDQMGHGTIFKAIGRDELRSLKIVSPPPMIGDAFEQIAGPIWDLIKNLTFQNRNLRAQRDFLLPKLISGEIDVSAAPLQQEAAE